MEILLLAILAIGTLWNAFSTVYGAMSILGDGLLQVIASLLFSALVLGFVLNTTKIIRTRSGFIGGLLTFFWFISVCYNFYTSWIGNRRLLGGEGEVGLKQSYSSASLYWEPAPLSCYLPCGAGGIQPNPDRMPPYLIR